MVREFVVLGVLLGALSLVSAQSLTPSKRPWLRGTESDLAAENNCYEGDLAFATDTGRTCRCTSGRYYCTGIVTQDAPSCGLKADGKDLTAVKDPAKTLSVLQSCDSGGTPVAVSYIGALDGKIHLDLDADGTEDIIVTSDPATNPRHATQDASTLALHMGRTGIRFQGGNDFDYDYMTAGLQIDAYDYTVNLYPTEASGTAGGFLQSSLGTVSHPWTNAYISGIQGLTAVAVTSFIKGPSIEVTNATNGYVINIVSSGYPASSDMALNIDATQASGSFVALASASVRATCGNVSVNPASISANSKGTTTVSATGVKQYAACSCSPRAAWDDDLVFEACYVGTNDNLSIVLYNETGGSIDAGAQTLDYCCTAK